MHILIVEDDEDHARLLIRSMSRCRNGLVIDVCPDGEAALAYLRRRAVSAMGRPDLVLLDLNLPRKNGHETLAAIRADPDLRSLRVVVVSTSTSERDRDFAASAGVENYLVKPIGARDCASFLGPIDTGGAQG